MFPESFALQWIERLTQPGDLILDPFCGRGTAPFQAMLMGRRAFAVDINPVAYCVTKAKLCAPSQGQVEQRIMELKDGYEPTTAATEIDDQAEFFELCFHQETLRKLLYLRHALDWRGSDVDAMIAALVLGALHGELGKSNSYFSNQMPRTVSTKPGYSVRYWRQRGLLPPNRDVFRLLQAAVIYRYESRPAEGQGEVFQGDVRSIAKYDHIRGKVDCVVTSPPYFDTTSFEEDQWLRLWFLGGPSYPTKGRISRDDRHLSSSKYWAFIGSMWRALGEVVRPGGHVVVRIGARHIAPGDLEKKLFAAAMFSERPVYHLTSWVSEIRRRQTDHFRPGSTGCRLEVDCHFVFG